MKQLLATGVSLLFLLCIPSLVAADSTYGSGQYGSCEYSSCSISVSSSSTVSLNVTPDVTGKCTIQSDSVSVLTGNTNGYTLTLASSTTSTDLVNGATNIATSGGTSGSPATLTANSWGYRVDGIGGFGAGPTTAQSNISIPSTTFGGIPASNQTAATIASTSAAANPAQTTTVWYGACIDTTVPNGSYVTNVTYTATTN